MSADGQAEFPVKGFSEVDTLDVGFWCDILDAENGNMPTRVANFGAGNVRIPLGTNPKIITPATLLATQAAYSPPDWLLASMARLTPFAGGSEISSFESTGIVPLVRTVRNLSDTDDIVFKHEDLTELTPARRISVPGATDFTLGPKGSVTMFYDALEAAGVGRWTFI